MTKTIFTPLHHKISKRLQRFFLGLGITAWAAASIIALAPSFPHLLYRLSPQIPQALAQTIANTERRSPPKTNTTNTQPLPPKDTSLPNKNMLLIESIGVAGLIHQGDNWQEILEQGIWATPGWDNPENQDTPVIIASHRWGYLDWSNDFRRKNSFYSLPSLKDGDIIEIIWNQRQYTYEIYSSNTGEDITDYSADLIIYTCKLWNSPLRIFKYAKRI